MSQKPSIQRTDSAPRVIELFKYHTLQGEKFGKLVLRENKSDNKNKKQTREGSLNHCQS